MKRLRKDLNGMKIADQSRIGKLLLSLESKQRREREAVRIWKQNYGNVMTSYM
jgi:hypothetical protein